MDVIPNFWTYKNPITIHKDVLPFRPYFGPTQWRGFGDGKPQLAWELSDDDAAYDDALEMRDFWDDHYPGVAFELHDVVLGVKRVYEFDSDFNFTYNHQDSYSWSVRIKEVYPYTETPL